MADAGEHEADRIDVPAPGLEAEALCLARVLFEEMGEIGVRQALIETPDGHRALAAVPSVPGLRDAMMDALRALLRRERALGVAVVSEVWYAQQPADVPRAALPADLSTYDGRRERVLVVVEHRALDAGASRMWHAEITRSAPDGAGKLGPWVRNRGHAYSGRMVGLLPPAEGRADG